MKKGSNNKYSPFNNGMKKEVFSFNSNSVKRGDYYIEKLKESCYSDNLINMVIELHKSDPSILPGAIRIVKENMKKFIDYGASIIDSYEYLLLNRVIRTGNCEDLPIDNVESFERNFFKIVIECFTEYRTEILIHEMSKGMKVNDVNGVKVISF